MIYADIDYYRERSTAASSDDAATWAALRAASRRVDILTYNRIPAIGWDRLTPFQRRTIRDVTCDLADFYEANGDMLETVLQSYAIGPVSIQGIGSSWNVVCQQGVALPRASYEQLKATGLCTAVI